MSALCGEYISQRIYKYVDVYNKYVDLLINAATYLLIYRRTNIYMDLLINTATYLLIYRRTYKCSLDQQVLLATQ